MHELDGENDSSGGEANNAENLIWRGKVDKDGLLENVLQRFDLGG